MNFQEKFLRWQEKMSKKSEEERNNYALTVAFLVGAIACFFVVSSWYYRITGNSVESGILDDFESFYLEQKQTYNQFFDNEK